MSAMSITDFMAKFDEAAAEAMAGRNLKCSSARAYRRSMALHLERNTRDDSLTADNLCSLQRTGVIDGHADTLSRNLKVASKYAKAAAEALRCPSSPPPHLPPNSDSDDTPTFAAMAKIYDSDEDDSPGFAAVVQDGYEIFDEGADVVVAPKTIKIAYADSRDALVAYAATTKDKVIVCACREVFVDIVAASEDRLMHLAVAPTVVAIDEAHMMLSLFDEKAYEKSAVYMKIFRSDKKKVFCAEGMPVPQDLRTPLNKQFVKWLCQRLQSTCSTLQEANEEAMKVAKLSGGGGGGLLPEELDVPEIHQFIKAKTFRTFWHQEMLREFVVRVAPELKEEEIDFETFNKLCGDDVEAVEKIKTIKRTREDIPRAGKDSRRRLTEAGAQAAAAVRDFRFDVDEVPSVKMWNEKMDHKPMRSVQTAFSALVDPYLDEGVGAAMSIMAALPGGMGKSLMSAFNVMKKVTAAGGKAFVVAPYEMHQHNMAESFAEAVKDTEYVIVSLKKHANALAQVLSRASTTTSYNVELTKLMLDNDDVLDHVHEAKIRRNTKNGDGRGAWRKKGVEHFIPRHWPVFLLTATPECFNVYHTMAYGIKKFYAAPEFLASIGQILYPMELLTATDVHVPDEFVDMIRQEAEKRKGFKFVDEFTAERRSFLDQIAKTIEMCLRTTHGWRERKDGVLAPMQNVWAFCSSNQDAEWQSIAARLLCNTPEGRAFLRRAYFRSDPKLVPEVDFMKTASTLAGRSNTVEITKFIEEQKGWGSRWGLRDENSSGGPVTLMFAFCTRLLTTGIDCDALHAVWFQRAYEWKTWLQIVYRAMRVRKSEDGKNIGYMLMATHTTTAAAGGDQRRGVVDPCAQAKADLAEANAKKSISVVVGNKHMRTFMTSVRKSRKFKETHGLVMNTRLKVPLQSSRRLPASSSGCCPENTKNESSRCRPEITKNAEGADTKLTAECFSMDAFKCAVESMLQRDPNVDPTTTERYLKAAVKVVTIEKPWSSSSSTKVPADSELKIDRGALVLLVEKIAGLSMEEINSQFRGGYRQVSAVFGKIGASLL